MECVSDAIGIPQAASSSAFPGGSCRPRIPLCTTSASSQPLHSLPSRTRCPCVGFSLGTVSLTNRLEGMLWPSFPASLARISLSQSVVSPFSPEALSIYISSLRVSVQGTGKSCQFRTYAILRTPRLCSGVICLPSESSCSWSLC